MRRVKKEKKHHKESSDILMGCIRQTMGIPLNKEIKDNAKTKERVQGKRLRK